MLDCLGTHEVASKKSLEQIYRTMSHLSKYPPKVPKSTDAKEVWIESLHQGAQLILTIFITLHLTGEPVSIGRVDYLLRHLVPTPPAGCTELNPSQEEQDIIDSFWLKVG